MTLTHKQRATLDFIRAFHLEHGHCPTIRQINAARGLTGIGNTHDQVRKLAGAGYLRLHAKRRFELLALNALTLDLPSDLAKSLRKMAARNNATVEAVAIECIRGGVSLFCSEKVTRKTDWRDWPTRASVS